MTEANNQFCVALPSQSNGQVGVEGNHTAQSSGRGRQGSFHHHKMDSVVQPSAERGRQLR